MSLLQGPAAMKVTAEHLRRNAYLYVRQSTLRQVLTNTESTHRQYDLRGRAVALGWAAEQVIVIDSDQGQSGATATERDDHRPVLHGRYDQRSPGAADPARAGEGG